MRRWWLRWRVRLLVAVVLLVIAAASAVGTYAATRPGGG